MLRVLVVIGAVAVLAACGQSPTMLSVTVQGGGGQVCVESQNPLCANTNSDGIAQIDVSSLAPGYYGLDVGGTPVVWYRMDCSPYGPFQVKVDGSPAPVLISANYNGGATQ